MFATQKIVHHATRGSGQTGGPTFVNLKPYCNDRASCGSFVPCQHTRCIVIASVSACSGFGADMGLRAAMQARSMGQGGRHAVCDGLGGGQDNGPWFLRGASAAADLERSQSSSMAVHLEWRQAMDRHRAAHSPSAMHARCVPATQDPPTSLLGDAYGTQLPGFLKAALHGSTSAAAAEQGLPSRVTSGAEADVRLPYALAWDGPEVRRLAQLWRSRQRHTAASHRGRAARPASKPRQQPPSGRRGGSSAKRRRIVDSSESEEQCQSSSSSDESGRCQSVSSAGVASEAGSGLVTSGEESESTEGAARAAAHLPSAVVVRMPTVQPAAPAKKRILATMRSNPGALQSCGLA